MRLYILNPEYEQIGHIDEAESILWNKKYNDVGLCEIYLPCNDEMLSMLQKGNYVFRYDDDMFCRIETLEITTDAEQGDYIIATANDMANVLAGRCVMKPFTYSGTLANFVYKLLDENIVNPTDTKRKIDNFVIDTSNFDALTDTIETSTTEEDVLQTIITTCKARNYGFRVSYDVEVGQLVFGLKKGENKATTDSENYVEFSPAFSNILASNYKEDESNYKNVACVSYENERGKPAMTTAYIEAVEPQGEARKELLVDGSGVNREVTNAEIMALYPTAEDEIATHTYKLPDGTIIATFTVDENGMSITLTDNGYIPLVQEVGRQALPERARTQEFNGTIDIIDTYEYKTDYDIGDIVKVINEHGIEAEARIVEIMESEDNDNGYVIEPKYEYQN